MSFSSLKQSRSSSFDKLNTQLQKLNNTGANRGDDRFWKPEVDKAGNGFAVIRFLPSPSGEDMPFVRMWDHGFQGPGGWYIENSLTTLGQDDPVSEYNSKLWNSGYEEDKDQARKQKRRLSYVSNIYVVKDSANPENEGKVFLYKFGKKIFDKLNDAMNPEFEGDEAVNPFDFWEGADFKLKIRNYEGYRNYDRSEFAAPTVLGDMDDDELEAVYNRQHSLNDIVDPKNFKSYDELKAKLFKVLQLDSGASAPAPSSTGDDNEEMSFTPNFKERSAPKMEEASSPSLSSDNVDDDDSLDFFKSLAED